MNSTISSGAAQPRAVTRSSVIPGVLVSTVVAAAAFAGQDIETSMLARAWLEPLVLAILLGAVVRGVTGTVEAWKPGISFSSKALLEIAIVALGASASLPAILAAGPRLLIGIPLIVLGSIGLSFAVGRALGLHKRLALLIACGNSICGNSAIAAVAPVIGADGDEVASAIAFTAVLGIVVVLGLPFLGMATHMGALRYGAFAGLTVYAVPQVVAAAAPFGQTAVQIGALVKLVRVLMLGPVCLLMSLVSPTSDGTKAERPQLAHLVPWFIIGFAALLTLRSIGAIPAWAVSGAARTSSLLTVVAMASLGLSVEAGSISKSGWRSILSAVFSLLMLSGIGMAYLHLMRIG